MFLLLNMWKKRNTLAKFILLCILILHHISYSEALAKKSKPIKGAGIRGGGSISVGGFGACIDLGSGVGSVGFGLGKGKGKCKSNKEEPGKNKGGKPNPQPPKTTPPPPVTTPPPVKEITTTTSAPLLTTPGPGEEIPGVSAGNSNYSYTEGSQMGPGFNISSVAPFSYPCYQCSIYFLLNEDPYCTTPNKTLTCRTSSTTPYCVAASYYLNYNETHYGPRYYKGCLTGCHEADKKFRGASGTLPYYCTQCIGDRCNTNRFIPLPPPGEVGLPDILG